MPAQQRSVNMYWWLKDLQISLQMWLEKNENYAS